jgi:hypothetical protein
MVSLCFIVFLEDIMQFQNITVEPFRCPDFEEFIEFWKASYKDKTINFNCLKTDDGSFFVVTQFVVGKYLERPGRAGRFIDGLAEDGSFVRIGGPVLIAPNGSVKRRSAPKRHTSHLDASAALYVDKDGNATWVRFAGSHSSVVLACYEDAEPVEFDELPAEIRGVIVWNLKPLVSRMEMGEQSVGRYLYVALNKKKH